MAGWPERRITGRQKTNGKVLISQRDFLKRFLISEGGNGRARVMHVIFFRPAFMQP